MRLWRQLLIVIVLGLISTVLIAWAFAIWKHVPMYAGTPSATLPRPFSCTFVRWNRPWQVNEITGVGFDDIWWLDLHVDWPAVDAARCVADSRALRENRTDVAYSDAPPTWGTLGGKHHPPENLIGSDTAYGWPIPCLWYQVVGHIEGHSEYGDFIYGAWFLRGQLEAVSHTYTAIPLRPIWKPLLIDIDFYAVIWWLLLFAPAHLRRVLRRRHGACPGCGYNLQPDPSRGCPECGWNRVDIKTTIFSHS